MDMDKITEVNSEWRELVDSVGLKFYETAIVQTQLWMSVKYVIDTWQLLW